MNRRIANILLNEKAVFFRPDEPFTWTSGIKAPIYCDNRLLISDQSARKEVVNSFNSLIKEENIAIVGTATAGIPWGAWIAWEKNLPFAYIRSSEKKHGRQNALEGKLTPGQKVILIEDLISTGKSSLDAAEKLIHLGHPVTKVMSIFTYNFPGVKERFTKMGIEAISLTDFEVLAEEARSCGNLDESNFLHVINWKNEQKVV
ncbi:MAG TPA: orotate phosphoribosyltransferase [Bacteriovoracaceae bacterium]|nr:orotate phosphoribosyltransferase [Bacteriovoracaceae bacterium]